MDLNQYQAKAMSTALEVNAEHMAFGLVEEAGEVAAIMKRFHRGDAGYFDEWASEFDFLSVEAVNKLEAELGDILWYVAVFANHLGLSLNEVAIYNLNKLQSRKARDMLRGSGDDR